MIRLVLVSSLILSSTTAFAQSLGAFRWQLQPYCNVVTMTVTRIGDVYTLDGFDDQCGDTTRAPLNGTAVPNPNGTIALGLNVVTSPRGQAVHVAVTMNAATLRGTWTDSERGSGIFAFSPPVPATGTPRPAPAPAFPVGLTVGPTTLYGDGGILTTGKEDSGQVPPFSVGTRMSWHPGKGAFRAGALGRLEDDKDMGLFSVAMGYGATASGRFAISLGPSNASGDRSVALGAGIATGESAVALGFLAHAGGKNSVAIGSLVRAYGTNSVALGTDASTEFYTGSFVYGDGGSLVTASANNQFTARAKGGVRFFTNFNSTSGVTLAAGGSAWASVSDVNMKENFRDLDGGEVLARIAAMPIREWNYKSQDAAIRHVGPTAQDFHAAFGLGEDPLRISTIDADGIALAAIRALEARTRELGEQNRALQQRLEELERLLARR